MKKCKVLSFNPQRIHQSLMVANESINWLENPEIEAAINKYLAQGFCVKSISAVSSACLYVYLEKAI